jgi:hypothetical protein
VSLTFNDYDLGLLLWVSIALLSIGLLSILRLGLRISIVLLLESKNV